MLEIAEAVSRYANSHGKSFDAALREFLNWLEGDFDEDGEGE